MLNFFKSCLKFCFYTFIFSTALLLFSALAAVGFGQLL